MELISIHLHWLLGIIILICTDNFYNTRVISVNLIFA